MKQYAYGLLGIVSVGIVMLLAAVPGLVFAEEVETVTDASVEATSAPAPTDEVKRDAPLRREVRPVPPEVRARAEVRERVEVKGDGEVEIEREIKMRDGAMREEVKERMAMRDARLLEITPENAMVRALSLEELRMKREERRAELEDEAASTTPRLRDTVKNANEVRLAVHTLLASKDLLGGIGPQVSEIAKRMNDAVASTTNAEARIESRGLLRKLFFGGDTDAAELIQARVDAHQADLEKLKELLASGTVSAEVAADLEAQIEVLEKAQERLAALAEKEEKRWGIFSWRLFRAAPEGETGAQ